MSKSLGNITAPEKVINEFGADVLRLWVVGSDYYDDLRIGKEILVRHSDHYRRLRNTLRYLLGALNGFEEKEIIDFDEMPELEQWVLHRVAELGKKIEKNTTLLVLCCYNSVRVRINSLYLKSILRRNKYEN